MYTATHRTWQGVPVVELAGPSREAVALVAPEAGANLFARQLGGREWLRQPADSEALRRGGTGWGVPVLMPPSRTVAGRFQFGGRDYQLEINTPTGHNLHGLVLRRPWAVEELTASAEEARVRLAFRAETFPEVMAQFPHPFVLTLTYVLSAAGLRCETEIANGGAEAMPFGLGFHPYFVAPVGSELRVTQASLWEMVEMIPSGRLVAPEGALDLSDWQPVHAVRRDHGYALTAAEPDGWSQGELRVPGGAGLVLRASPEYKHWVIYNGRAEVDGFVCLEPYTCTGNAFNLPEVSGMTVIGPGETRHAGTWTLAAMD